MIFAPSPDDLVTMGSLPDVVTALNEHIAAERRRVWEVPCLDIVVHPDGRIGARGHPPLFMERAGFDGLLKQVSACLPRAPTLLSRVSPRLFSEVWHELMTPENPEYAGLPFDVKMHERTARDGTRAVWAASPTTWPHAYNGGRLVSDILDLWSGAPPMAVLEYSAALSSGKLTLGMPQGAVAGLPDYSVVVSTVDQYDQAGVNTSVVVNGLDLGDPVPGVRSRRRASADGTSKANVAEAVLAKVRASRTFLQHHLGKLPGAAGAAGGGGR